MTHRKAPEILVIGAGLTGLAAALALAALEIEVALIAPPADAPAGGLRDARSTALLASSVEFLINLEVWPLCREASEPLRAIRIVDDRPGLLQAPEVLFEASALGLPEFGANILNGPLLAALRTAAASARRIVHIASAGVRRLEPAADQIHVALAEGKTLSAKLVVAADGHRSLARSSAGITTRTWTYPQAAVATSFSHTRPHAGITTELHREAGPLTTVPLPGRASACVWVEAPERARALAALPDADFTAALEEALKSHLGQVTLAGERRVYPLAGLVAERMGGNRVALVGEAAHVIPPIGAQGLNLSLRDAAALADCVAGALRAGGDPGAPEVLDSYETKRRGDVTARTVGVDLLNRSLLLDAPAQVLRGAALHLLANFSGLRRLAMQAGLSPVSELPSLMRPNAAASGTP
jgi:2-octaprenyl-6-methoxyphenol hydroxylase